VPAGTTLERLVDEFVATLKQHGVAVEREMRDPITDIADRLGVDPDTVLREHARDGWGRTMATDVTAQIHDEQLLDGRNGGRAAMFGRLRA
jgi:hypothetical protein